MDWIATFGNLLTDYRAGLLAWLDRPGVFDSLMAGLLATVGGAFVVWLVVQLRRGLAGLPTTLRGLLAWRRVDALEVALTAYRKRLATEALTIRHAWMKQDQCLGDILVPVAVETGADHGIEQRQTALRSLFAAARENPRVPAPRIVVLGGPGTGKTVALRLIARDAPALPHRDPTEAARGGWVPVRLSFADLRDAGFDLPAAVAAGLDRGGLTLPRQTSTPVGPAPADPLGAWARTALDEGRLLVLVDGLDELDRDARTQAARAVNQAVAAWPRCAFVISCRSAARRDQLESPHRAPLHMAPLHAAAVRQFVRRWRFDAPKSAEELQGVIRRQPHVAALAVNPLMLTIVCFLYGQPKYRLPDNRAQFYEVCARALLEEWDQAQGNRANAFDRPHKEHLLAALAHAHIAGPDPERDIDEGQALTLLAREMEQGLGLRRADNHRLLDELVLNAGLLVRLPPAGLRFPHQTFLEYFAAQHLLVSADLEAMLARYRADPGRWREVLLLYCGLCTRTDAVGQVLDLLLARGELPTALSALTEARVVDLAAAGRVLDSAAAALGGIPDTAVLAGLGYLAANPRTAFGENAADLLHRLLRERADQLPAATLQALLLAALRRPTPEVTAFVIDNLDRLQLALILPALGEEALGLSRAILGQAEVPIAKRREWIDGLRRAQAVATLFDLDGLPGLDPTLRQAVLVALARCSQLDEFWTRLDQAGDGQADPLADDPESALVLRRWGWPYRPPLIERGRRYACRVAVGLSRDIEAPVMDDVHPRLGYLAMALAVERGPRPDWDWKPADDIATGAVANLRAIWRLAGRPQWAQWMKWVDSSAIPNWNIVTVSIASSSLLSLLLGVSLATRALGWGDLGMHSIVITIWFVFMFMLVILLFPSGGAFQTLTHPTMPSDATRKLVFSLQDFRQVLARGPHGPDGSTS